MTQRKLFVRLVVSAFQPNTLHTIILLPTIMQILSFCAPLDPSLLSGMPSFLLGMRRAMRSRHKIWILWAFPSLNTLTLGLSTKGTQVHGFGEQ